MLSAYMQTLSAYMQTLSAYMQTLSTYFCTWQKLLSHTSFELIIILNHN